MVGGGGGGRGKAAGNGKGKLGAEVFSAAFSSRSHTIGVNFLFFCTGLELTLLSGLLSFSAETETESCFDDAALMELFSSSKPKLAESSGTLPLESSPGSRSELWFPRGLTPRESSSLEETEAAAAAATAALLLSEARARSAEAMDFSGYRALAALSSFIVSPRFSVRLL
jgi:hypothetical protein